MRVSTPSSITDINLVSLRDCSDATEILVYPFILLETHTNSVITYCNAHE